MEDNASSTSNPHMYTSQETRYAAAMPPTHESPQPLSEFSDYTTSTESPTATADRVDESGGGLSASLLKFQGRIGSPLSFLPGLMNGDVASRGDSLPVTPVFRMRSTGDQQQRAGAAVVPPAPLGPAIEAAKNALVAAANAASPPPPKPHVNGIAEGAALTAAAAPPKGAFFALGGSPPVRSTDLSSPGVDTQGGVSPSSSSSHVVRQLVLNGVGEVGGKMEESKEDDRGGCDEAGGGGGMEKGGDAVLLTPRSREGTRKTSMADRDSTGVTEKGRSESPVPRILPRVGKSLQALNGRGRLEDAFALARERVKEIRPLESVVVASELGGLLRQAVLGDWHSCAMPFREPPRDRVRESAEWNAWIASEGVSKQEAMKIFTAAVNKLYLQKFPNADLITWVSTTDSDADSGEPITAELPLSVDLSHSLIPRFPRNDIENGKGMAVKYPRESNAQSPQNNASKVKTLFSSRKTLYAKPVFSGQVASSTKVDAAASRRVMTEEGRKFGNEGDPAASRRVMTEEGRKLRNEGDDASSRRVMTEEGRKFGNEGDPAASRRVMTEEGRKFGNEGGAVEQRNYQDGGGLEARMLGGVGEGSKQSNGGDDWRMRSTAGSASTAAAAATATGIVDQRTVDFFSPRDSGRKMTEISSKTGVLYKKREIFPGWRPRTFILDKSQKMLRYYLPSSANPRGNIPLEGCLVDFSASATDKGEAGPDGARLFRIRLITSSISGNSTASPRFAGFVGGGGSPEGMNKAYILAATSFREAQSWASAIREVADSTDHSRERSLDRSFWANGSSELQRGRQREEILSMRKEASSSSSAAAAVVDPSRWVRSPVNGITSDPAERRVGSAERRGSRAVASVGRTPAFAFAATEEAYKQNRSPEPTADPSTSYPGSVKSVQAKEEAKKMDATREQEGFPQWVVAFAVVAASVVLMLLERVIVPLGWVGVAAGSVGTVVAIATDRSRIRKQRGYLEQLLRDNAHGNDRYHVRFWLDVQPLMAQLERIQPSEFVRPERHSKTVVQPSDVTVLHLVMKAVASALMEVNPPRGSVVKRGEHRNRAREGLSARETRESLTRVACVPASDNHRTRIGSLDGEPRVVVIEGAERKSAAMIAAEVLTTGDLAGREEENVDTVSRWSNGVVDLFPVLLRQPPNEVPLLHPESLSTLANGKCARDVLFGGIPWQGVEGRADCLVEVEPFPRDPALLQKASNPAGVSQDTLLSKVYGDRRLSDLSLALDGNGSGGVRETRRMIRAPLKVIVGCMSALVDGREEEKGSGSNAPVAMLELSVVGDAATGEKITGDFARALKRCLLRFEI